MRNFLQYTIHYTITVACLICTGTRFIQKIYAPPPLPYFKVSICPLPLPHFASIFFAYL